MSYMKMNLLVVFLSQDFMLHLDFLVLRSKYYTISIIIYHPTLSLVKLKTSGRITGKTTRNPPDYESK